MMARLLGRFGFAARFEAVLPVSGWRLVGEDLVIIVLAEGTVQDEYPDATVL